MDPNIAEFKRCFDNVGKDLLVEGTNKFSRFFIKLFHRSGNNEITIHIPNSNTGKTSSLNLRKASAANEPNTANDPNATTINGQSGQTHSIRIRKHRRHSKNEKLFEKLANRAIITGVNIDLDKTAKKLGLDPSTSPIRDLIEKEKEKEPTFSKLRNFIQETFLNENEINSSEEQKNIINFVHDLQRTGIDKSISPEDINTFFQIYPTDNPKIEKVKEFLLKITTPVDFKGRKTTQLVLSESRRFLKEFNITSKELDDCRRNFISAYKLNFIEKTFKSSNPIGKHIHNKVLSPSSLFPKKLPESFELSINDSKGIRNSSSRR